MRGLKIAIALLAGLAAGQALVDRTIPHKDQARLNRVACGAGDIPVVDPVGNIVGCSAIKPGSTFAKRG